MNTKFLSFFVAFDSEIHRSCCTLIMSSLFRPIETFGRYPSLVFPCRCIPAVSTRAASLIPRKSLYYSKHRTSTFSTMPTLKDNVTAVPARPDQFDSEITDIATYVHKYKIDSKLAVGILLAIDIFNSLLQVRSLI